MKPAIALVACLVPALALGAEPKEKKHELSFKKDGDALIASTTIQINDDKHLLLATFDNTEALAPGLQYTVIQNSDSLTTKKKNLTIEWRITGESAKVNPWRVHGQVIKLSTAELKLLGGKALELVP